MRFDAKETAERLRVASGNNCLLGNILEAFGCEGFVCTVDQMLTCEPCKREVLDRIADALDPRDTQERIDEDAKKLIAEYWGCYGKACDECPSTIDGKTPYQRYGSGDINCHVAKTFDLLRRQREFDWRVL